MVINIVVAGAKFLGKRSVKRVIKNLAMEVAAGITARTAVHFGSKALIKAIKNNKQKETEDENDNIIQLQEVRA